MERKIWLRVALLNFLFAAVLGAALRYAFVAQAEFKFRYVMHAHSHVAMLGWIYLALFALLVYTFLPEAVQRSKKLSLLFWLTEGSVLGMLLTFPAQGYAVASITFSSAHVLLSYAFAYLFLRQLPPSQALSRRFVVASIGFMILSTLALWATGPIIVFNLKGSALYYAAIQFFLHFQFNGWFIFAVLGLFLYRLEQRGSALPKRGVKIFYGLLFVSCLLTYALAVAWTNPLLIVFIINGAGVLLQLAAAAVFFALVWPRKQGMLPKGWSGRLLGLAFYSFLAKILMQAVVVVPFVATAAYTIRNYVIGFIHLIQLGAISAFLIGFALERGWLRADSTLARAGLALFVAGFLLSEALLFLQGTMFWGAMGFLPAYYELLFGASALLPLGVACFSLAQAGSGSKHSSA